MPGALLTTASKITCTHGGQAILTTANGRVSAGASVLLESDVHPVVGCPFTIGPKYSPCTRIQWSAGASAASVGGQAPLVQSSIGQCMSGEGAVQGIAIVGGGQSKATA